MAKVKLHVKKPDGNFQEFEVITTTDSVTNADGTKTLTEILEEIPVSVITEEQIDAAIAAVFNSDN